MNTENMSEEDCLEAIKERKQKIKFLKKNAYMPFMSLTKIKDGFSVVIVEGPLTSAIMIGKLPCPTALRGRCLILSDQFDWEIIKYDDDPSTKLLVCKKKKTH